MADDPTPAATEAPPPGRVGHEVSFAEALRVFVRVAILSFGGPAGQIAVMQRIFVDEKRWFSQRRFLHAMSYTMLLPGPEAQQLATYAGWMLHGWRGGLTAGSLFVLPGFLSILALSVLYVGFGEVAVVAAVFYGLKPAVLAIVLEALLKIGRRALHGGFMVTVAVVAFVAIFVFGVPFPWIVALALVAGLVGQRFLGERLMVIRPPADPAATPEGSLFHDDDAAGARPPAWRTVSTVVLWLAIWWIPVGLLAASFGPESVFVEEGLFFSKTAVVTFGGAYAVLAYIAQQAVEVYAWLQPGEMLDGLAMAETTPGPLIQVVQFVGFLGAHRNPGALDPLVAGVLGSLVTTWVTFAPCFLWIFAGAPYIEYLRGRRALTAALSTITAAVVGVVLNLALWFGIHTLFQETRQLGAPFDMTVPVLSTVDPAASAIAAVAFLALFRLRWGMFATLGICALLGVVHGLTIGS
ncbi:MAG: chromate transporter [Acidobacteria bacterium]|nr:MAG: chromate transporter [Acidobacteriota bacterium]REK08805.1 MAG: chromate transporter [Acidobacteriota bacterium]